MTDKKWWTDSFPSQYYAFATDKMIGGYPVAGLANLDIYSKQPDWLTSRTAVVALTQAEWLAIVPRNLIIKDGTVQTYVAPVTVVPLKTQAATAQAWIQQQANLAAAMGEVFTADMKAYVKAIAAIANGTDTTSTALPGRPSDIMS